MAVGKKSILVHSMKNMLIQDTFKTVKGTLKDIRQMSYFPTDSVHFVPISSASYK